MTAPSLHPLEIVGGGLAGLSLGLALRRTGVPVTLFEAGSYPRHRVCGEFITGLSPETIGRLGLAPFLADARRHREVTWFLHDRPLRRQTLPRPALALSRHALDRRLADAFANAGGTLRTQTRVNLDDAPAGRVFAAGRRPDHPGWIGLKCHVFNLPLGTDLELHLGDHAYTGLCAVEDGRVNVSGLFRKTDGLEVSRETALFSHLRAAGLGALADRLACADIDPASFSAVSGLGFSKPPANADRLLIGDSYAMTPPFTGNGMAMAFHGAAQALDPLLAWSRGAAGWDATVRAVHLRLRALFRVRLASAAALHPFLLRPSRQCWLARAGRLGLLPLRPLYRATH